MTKVLEQELKNQDLENKKIEAIAEKLQKKYSKKRTINEKSLNQKFWSRLVSVTLSVVCTLVTLFAIVFCISSFNSTIQRVVPSFAGYSNMRVSSGSMVKSGFNIGDVVVVKQVDTHTIKPNDIIAFYTYSKSYYGVNVKKLTPISVDDIGEHSTKLSALEFFGVKNAYMQEAGKAGAMLVFHHVRAVYEDANGKRWFTTYGSSNASDDTWAIAEEYVVGVNDNSKTGQVLSSIINFMSGPFGKLALLIIPLGILGFVLIKQLIYDIQISKLQLDVVEEKRKLTDNICVKHKIGYSMDNKTKYKVLAQASMDEKNEYLSLLWKNGSAPNNIRKYYMRKKFITNSDAELRDVNRQCEEMFKQGEDPKKIAKFYDTRKTEIFNKLEEKKRKLKAIKEKYKSYN